MKSYQFHSAFATDIDKFITHKQALGYTYTTQIMIMKEFDTFCLNMHPESYSLSQELLLHWVQRKKEESIGTQKVRVSATRQFTIFLSHLGYDVYMIPKKIHPYPQQYIPYIFSIEQILALFDKIDYCKYWPQNPIRQHEYSLLFRLLYCCGFRVSEVCNMKISDWNENNGTLTVYTGKYKHERNVPLAPDMAERTLKYCQLVHRFSSSDTYLFPSNKSPHLSKQAVYFSFRQFLSQAGISHGGKGKGPRLHDLRHTFAVHRLKQWVEEGKDINAFLPLLKTYMGHTRLRQTAYYLRMTADVFPAVISSVENAFPELIPNIGE